MTARLLLEKYANLTKETNDGSSGWSSKWEGSLCRRLMSSGGVGWGFQSIVVRSASRRLGRLDDCTQAAGTSTLPAQTNLEASVSGLASLIFQCQNL